MHNAIRYPRHLRTQAHGSNYADGFMSDCFMFNASMSYEPAQYTAATQYYQVVLALSTVAPQLLVAANASLFAALVSLGHQLRHVALAASGKQCRARASRSLSDLKMVKRSTAMPAGSSKQVTNRSRGVQMNPGCANAGISIYNLLCVNKHQPLSPRRTARLVASCVTCM